MKNHEYILNYGHIKLLIKVYIADKEKSHVNILFGFFSVFYTLTVIIYLIALNPGIVASCDLEIVIRWLNICRSHDS